MRFNFASPAINSAAAEGMSETRSDPGVSNFIQTPSVNNCILTGMSCATIGETEVEPCGCIPADCWAMPFHRPFGEP
jgi:hypothetical protein